LFLFLFADGAGGIELARPLRPLARIGHRRLARGTLGLLARDGGLLPARIDLHQRRAGRDAVARFHEDLRDLPVDLRLDGRRMQRLERGDVFGRVLDRRRPGRRNRHHDGRKGRRRGGRLSPVAGRGQRCGQHDDGLTAAEHHPGYIHLLYYA